MPARKRSSSQKAPAPDKSGDGKSIFDLFGRDFTLLCFSGVGSAGKAADPSADVGADVSSWIQAAAALGLPLDVLRCASAEARALYGADRVLIRPDHHVAWRGNAGANVGVEAGLEAGALLAMACGQAISSSPAQPHESPGLTAAMNAAQ